jgi:hypothetical protein
MPAGARTRGVLADTLECVPKARSSVPRPGVFAHRRGTYVFGSPATLARWSAEAKGWSAAAGRTRPD